MALITDTLNVEVPDSHPATALLRQRALHNIGFMFGAAIIALLVLTAILAPVLAPYDPYRQDLSARLVNPVWHADGTWAHPLGTDLLGRDYLSRMIYGARISLLIGSVTMLISGLIGAGLGVMAGYFGGRIDMIITFVITTRLAMPIVLVALAVVAVVGGSLTLVITVMSLLLWDRFAVVIRAATMRIRSLEFVMAARAIGCSTAHIVMSEIVPNLLNALTIIATIEMANAILLEATLSFLGLGVQPPLASWGAMVADGKDSMFFSPWLITIPGMALFLLAFAINLVGDGIRDITAPESRN